MEASLSSVSKPMSVLRPPLLLRLQVIVLYASVSANAQGKANTDSLENLLLSKSEHPSRVIAVIVWLYRSENVFEG